MENKQAMRFIIRGRVHGVLFRASAQKEANKLGLTGWVRNNVQDGSVEALATGDKTNLMQFYEWLKEGPSLAQVEKVEYSEVEWQKFDRFSVK